MQAKQLSVFIENREGRLDEVLAVIKTANVNILSLSLADTSEYGLLRLIVSDPAAADAALKANGFSSMLTDVLVVRLANKVGSLQSFLAEIAKTDINLEYMYGLTIEKEGKASLVIKASDLNKASAILLSSGAELLTAEDIAAL
ncbi:MAG TPA: amino acid-binding protein [Clostridiales bacterium]|nr:amino acid-binding protein [Clostridiales bacterium]HCU56037.1 amino acid-binding protein [Clostridiales bacterium]